jgi:hypothetical protein
MTTLLRSLVFLLAVTTAFAQSDSKAPKFPPASPTATLKQHIGLTDISVVYSRPGVKGRKVFGGITPYGSVWRTGANEPTLVTFSTDVALNGTAIPAGTYALYTIPQKDEWTIIIYKDTKLWGAFGYDQSKDFVRFAAKPVHLSHSVESFTIDFADLKDDSATLLLRWEKTEVPIHLELPQLVSTVSASIEAFAASSAKKTAGFDYNAANFYLQHGPDLDKALQYADAMIATGDAGSYEGMYVRAKVLQLKGDKAGAAEAAQKSKDAAVKREGPQTPWVQMNDDILAAVRE